WAASAAASPATDATVRFEAPIARLTAADPALEARMLAITGELRCLVCQNQTIADSHADLAVDLRQEVREMLQRGQTPDQIRRYMTDRYGDFILYRPPLNATTAVLWGAPAGLLAIALVALAVVIRRRSRLADDQFEPDPQLDDGPSAASDPSGNLV
ncbi:MAG: cytochrome c-type biogenesis protein CcmH, partial [Caulobacter sp.]|nr:cytochrome c-type biogenesis protein CcmH [Vitreoscilla sp.]